MLNWLRELDRILRGEATRLSAIRDGTIRIPIFGIGFLCILLGLFAGLCVGCFALLNRQPPVYIQLLASAVKVPLLFFLTLAVTFPSLYVFNALVGSRLSIASVLRLLIAGIAVTMAVLASFGPITAFFSVSTENYPFMILLNVVLFAAAGGLGLSFLLQTLHRLTLSGIFQRWAEDNAQPPTGAPTPPPAPPPGPPTHSSAAFEPQSGVPGAVPTSGPPSGVPGSVAPLYDAKTGAMRSPPGAPPMEMGALEPLPGQAPASQVKSVFRVWVIVFGLVGAQMAWVLRPFIGNPKMPFTWFRPRSSNFFEAVWNTILALFN